MRVRYLEGCLEEEMTTQSSILARKTHEQRSLWVAVYGGCKEQDMTEHTHTYEKGYSMPCTPVC